MDLQSLTLWVCTTDFSRFDTVFKYFGLDSVRTSTFGSVSRQSFQLVLLDWLIN